MTFSSCGPTTKSSANEVVEVITAAADATNPKLSGTRMRAKTMTDNKSISRFSSDSQ